MAKTVVLKEIRAPSANPKGIVLEPIEKKWRSPRYY